MRYLATTCRPTLLACSGLLITSALAGCGSSTQAAPSSKNGSPAVVDIAISPATTVVRAGSSLQFSANAQQALNQAEENWSVIGGTANGTITSNGLYQAPASPVPQPVQVHFDYGTTHLAAQVTVLNPLPAAVQLSPTQSSDPNTTITLTGSGFVPASTLLVNGTAVPTTFIDPDHLSTTITASAEQQTTFNITVSNPDPGAAVSTPLPFVYTPSTLSVSPSTLPIGQVTLKASALGIAPGCVLYVAGIPLSTIAVSGTTLTAQGYLPPWIQGTVSVSVSAPDGTPLGETTEAVTPTPVTFDAASRFSTQAAWGPRPDLVTHIQQIGFKAFIQEQLAQPVAPYHVIDTNPIRTFIDTATRGQSLLRLRTAWAFQTFIPGQTYFSNHNLALPWEQTLERDAFGNYRQILLDAASDPNIALLLNMNANYATNNPNVHPNQNFAREMMQLFSIGTVMLNQDGTPQLDANGHDIPAYDDNTVIDMSRLLTGWNYPPPQNPIFTGLFNIDFSIPLAAIPGEHDEGAKTLFGNVQIPANQTAEQDKEAAIDAVMNHPNTAPFVSKLLIQRLVKSQPSPAYVQRVAAVFDDNGQGVKGDLPSVITAILLDPEARAGDTTPDPSDGFLQDPVYQQLFFMSALQVITADDQPTYAFEELGENFWNPGTVFGYFPPDYVVPGTNIVAPEFQLLTNFTDVQRSEFLYTIVSNQQPGFGSSLTGWLYQNFNTIPELVDALNHLLYHGAMSTAEQQTILNYCASIPDPQKQRQAAIFLALNANSYLVSH